MILPTLASMMDSISHSNADTMRSMIAWSNGKEGLQLECVRSQVVAMFIGALAPPPIKEEE